MKTNRNHPAKGDQIKVEPIRKQKDIKAIKTLLADKPRDLALFTVGINTNLRASDLLWLTAGMVKDLPAMGEITLKEKKTGKPRRINLNSACIDAIKVLLASRPYKDDDPLFYSQRNSKLRVESVHRLVKSWCKMINLKGNYGSHTLRKTFGYHMHKTFNVSLPVLMETFNHSTQRQTLQYLCIQAEEIRMVYENEL